MRQRCWICSDAAKMSEFFYKIKGRKVSVGDTCLPVVGYQYEGVDMSGRKLGGKVFVD